MQGDPKPGFTLDQLKAFLAQRPDEPVETDFYSCREWAKTWECSRRKAQATLREVMKQDALEIKDGRRLAIDGKMRVVPLYKINLKGEEDGTPA